MRNAIARYFDDANLRNIIDLIQAQVIYPTSHNMYHSVIILSLKLLNCCGINGPNDWQSNPYFNCSSRAFQRCSVPFSCCVMVSSCSVVIYIYMLFFFSFFFSF